MREAKQTALQRPPQQEGADEFWAVKAAYWAPGHEKPGKVAHDEAGNNPFLPRALVKGSDFTPATEEQSLEAIEWEKTMIRSAAYENHSACWVNRVDHSRGRDMWASSQGGRRESRAA